MAFEDPETELRQKVKSSLQPAAVGNEVWDEPQTSAPSPVAEPTAPAAPEGTHWNGATWVGGGIANTETGGGFADSQSSGGVYGGVPVTPETFFAPQPAAPPVPQTPIPPNQPFPVEPKQIEPVPVGGFGPEAPPIVPQKSQPEPVGGYGPFTPGPERKPSPFGPGVKWAPGAYKPVSGPEAVTNDTSARGQLRARLLAQMKHRRERAYRIS